MFARYALVTGHGTHRHSLLRQVEAAGLRLCAETSELLLVAPAGTPFITGDRSILVGQLFSNENQRLSALPAGVDQCSGAAEVQRILHGYWGNYALFFGANDRVAAYREPSGSVSAYRIRTADGAIYVSDAELAWKLGLLERATPDLHFLVHWLQFPFLRTRRTGLAGVIELLPGMLDIRRHAGGWNEENVWSPWTILASGPTITDPTEAASRLRELALEVVPAQLDSRDRLLLRLSGGLDSSIIAACLAHGGHRFSCVNFATASRDGDERQYASEVAAAAGMQLQEVLERPELRLEIPARPSFRPPTNPLLQPFEQAVQSIARNVETSVLIDGAGGDNLFCSISSAAPVIDALQCWRFADAGRAITDIAERANCTISDVLLAATRRALRRCPPWKEDRSFLATRALLPSPELHPWLTHLRTQPGKREHVEALVHIHHFLDRGAASTRLLHPLLCQPLLELCLRIPSWLWVRGGRDRAVARSAFAGIVPSSVLGRRAKGSLQSMFHRSFCQLRCEMLRLLVAGELRTAGILDTACVAAALSGSASEHDEVQLRVSEMVALELWLRSWRSQPRGFSNGS